MNAFKNIPKVPLHQFLRHSLEIVKNPLNFHKVNFEKKGDTFKLMIGFTNSVLFSRDPRLLQYTLQKNHRNYIKSPIQTHDLAKYIGKGLLTAEGEHWKTQRKLIQPKFHKKHLAQLFQIIDSTIDEELEKIIHNKRIDIHQFFGELAFQVVAKSLFSGEISQEQISRLRYITEEAQKMAVRELRQPYLQWWFKWGGMIKKYQDLVDEGRILLSQLIKERKKSPAKSDDLLDMLLAARYEDGSVMAERQMIDELLILFTAGHETTANALSFTCLLLANHPEYQEQLYTEASLHPNLSFETTMRLSTCKHIIEEGMRLYPPAYFIDRVNIEEDEYDGYKLEKGTSLLFSLMEIHRHSDYWDNPETFQPERFSEESKSKVGLYYPFGAGPRMCIGNNFAMLEMQLTLSKLFKKYRIVRQNKEIEYIPLITLRPTNALVEFVNR